MEFNLNTELLFTILSLALSLTMAVIGGTILQHSALKPEKWGGVAGAVVCLMVAACLLIAFIGGLINIATAVLGDSPGQ